MNTQSNLRYRMKSNIFFSIIFFCISLIISSSMKAQNFSTGEYHLTGVHEMVAAFRFTPDGKFEFMYVYGAADRNATGNYTIDGDTLKLHSDKEPGKDFTVTDQRKKGSGYTVHIKSENTMMAENVICLYLINGVSHELYSDAEGFISIPQDACDEIYVQHLFFPDILTKIKDKSNPNNYFELALNPSLQQVSFKGIDFTIKGNTLTCLPNYFMPMDNIRFIKAKS